MTSELARFRIDPQVRDRAIEVCARQGYELSDVLRAFVARIARDGTIPIDLGAATALSGDPAPFTHYDERLWASLRPLIDAEIALALLDQRIAEASTALDELQTTAEPDPVKAVRLTAKRDQARALQRGLDVTDQTAVRQILDIYSRRPHPEDDADA